jgi:hypothetical protein
VALLPNHSDTTDSHKSKHQLTKLLGRHFGQYQLTHPVSRDSSKANHQSRLTREAAQNFSDYALKKMRDELRARRADNA